MPDTPATREALWAQQHLSAADIDFALWERDKSMLRQYADIHRSCTFVVDVYKCCYVFASSRFADLLGYDSRKIGTLENEGDYLESRIHPDDRQQLEAWQVTLSQFIYNQPFEQRNDYCNLYTFRVLNARRQYVRVSSKHQVLETDRTGKAWLVLGTMDIAPDQTETDRVDCTVLNLKTGRLFSPSRVARPAVSLTGREIEILRHIQQGLLSKEIAGKLGISIYTVHAHRQNLLRKMGVQHAIEAIRAGRELGLLG